MKTKPILCPGRLRHVPRQFSWIDQRLVRDRHIQGRSPEALALYLLLCTVADARGTSYYSDATAGGLLALSTARLREARAELLAAGLIAHRTPFYQVLSLEPGPAAAPAPPAPAQRPEPPRAGETLSAAEILKILNEAQQ
jgi:hypothetical protein